LAALALLLAWPFAVPAAEATGVGAPAPDLARLVPANYRVLKVLDARLTGQTEPEVVVSSVGPLNRYGVHPPDLQVLSWDALADRWNVLFDAQAARYRSAPVLDEHAVVRVGRVAFARFSRSTRRELVFAVTTYRRSGASTKLVVVDFWNGDATIDYLWSGNAAFSVAGRSPWQTVVGIAPYRSVVDAPSTPVRSYRFTIGLRGGFLRIVGDDRPWVGLFVSGTDRSGDHPIGTPGAHLRVIGVLSHSPAARVFRVGDVIVGLSGPRHARTTDLLGPSLIDKIAAQRARDRITFAVLRGGEYLRVGLRLGSLIDPSAPGKAPSIRSTFALV
jgi:S1-C subfamily serine protease